MAIRYLKNGIDELPSFHALGMDTTLATCRKHQPLWQILHNLSRWKHRCLFQYYPYISFFIRLENYWYVIHANSFGCFAPGYLFRKNRVLSYAINFVYMCFHLPIKIIEKLTNFR